MLCMCIFFKSFMEIKGKYSNVVELIIIHINKSIWKIDLLIFLTKYDIININGRMNIWKVKKKYFKNNRKNMILFEKVCRWNFKLKCKRKSECISKTKGINEMKKKMLLFIYYNKFLTHSRSSWIFIIIYKKRQEQFKWALHKLNVH